MNEKNDAKTKMENRLADITGLLEYHLRMVKQYKREIARIEKKLGLFQYQPTNKKGNLPCSQ